MSASRSRHKAAAVIYAVGMAALAAFLLFSIPGMRVNSSLLSLLPGHIMGAVPEEIERGFLDRIDRQMVFLVSSEDGGAAAADSLSQALSRDGMVAAVTGRLGEDKLQELGSFYFENRQALIDPATRQRLKSGTDQADFVLAQVFSAFAAVGGEELRNDPLLLTRSRQLGTPGLPLTVKDGYIASVSGERTWYLILAQSAVSSFSFHEAQQLSGSVEQYVAQTREAFPDAKILRRGSIFYSTYASQSAQHDIKMLGSCTVIGVFVLIFLVFGSARPLLLSICSIAAGIIAGSAVTYMFFGAIHSITLVMSVSVIGIASDYTVYYLTRRLVFAGDEDAFESLSSVRRALAMALVTTLAAYACMLLVPFAGVRQIAVFALSGLTASCLFVVYAEPYFAGKIRPRPVPFSGAADRYLRSYTLDRRVYIGLPLLFAAVSIAGLTQLEANDDVSLLQALPQDLKDQDEAITGYTGQGADQKFFIFYAEDDEHLLKLKEDLEQMLNAAREKGVLTGYRAFPLNSVSTQQKDTWLLREATDTVMAALAKAGVEIETSPYTPAVLSMEDYLGSPGAFGYDMLYLRTGEYRAMAVPVSGVSAPGAMRDIAALSENTFYIDRKSGFDSLFRYYRERLSCLVALALAAVLILGTVRMGVIRGLVMFVPSAVSVLFALAVLALCGMALNLFSTLALVLVIGIGINYTIFFTNARGEAKTDLLANTLAMLTTVLTLGMLIFSSTAAVSSFGIVLASGIICAYLLSPLAMRGRQDLTTEGEV